MKKVLAIVLTLAMLLSSMMVGLSAAQVVTETENVNHYWTQPSGNTFHFKDIGNQGSNFDVEMDIRLDQEDSSLSGFGTGRNPVFSTKGVGIVDQVIAGTYEVGRWYHIKWDAEDGKTTIYVDGVAVGTVNTTYDDTQLYYSYNMVSYDNYRVGNYFNDFENDSSDFQGQRVEYTIKADSIFDHFETKEVGGSAILLDQAPEYGASDINTYLDSNSFENDGFRVNQTSFIMNFDLSVLPNNDTSEGNCFEMWTNKSIDGTQLIRWKVGVMPTADGIKGFAGTENGSTKDYVQFDWGETSLNNFKNVTYVMNFAQNNGSIYIDGNLVYTANAGARAWDNMIFMPHNASCVLDNIQLMDIKYNPIENTTFKSSVAKTINLDAEDFCAANGHISGKLTRTAEPKCYEEGTDTIYCAVCGAVKDSKSVAKVAHNWASYDHNRRDSGLVYTYCKNSGCVERRYSTLPAASEYTGELKQYFDMNDDMILVIDNMWNSGTFAIVEGANGKNVLRFGAGTDDEANAHGYLEFEPASSVGANDWSWNMDFVYNGTFDTSDSTREDGSGYGHVVYFWLGGSRTPNIMVGYNADVNKLYLMPTAANPNESKPMPGGTFFQTVDFEMIEGETYNIQVSVSYKVLNTLAEPDEDDDNYDDLFIEYLKQLYSQYASLTMYVNGEAVIDWSYSADYDAEEDEVTEYGDYNAFLYIPNAADRSNPVLILREFGIAFDLKSMALGSSDFKYNRTYKGDVDGDNALTSADTLAMRKYLARVFGDEDICISRADANGDGVINAKDQLVMRKALMQ